MKPSMYMYVKMSKQVFKVFNVENQSLLVSQDLHSLQANLKLELNTLTSGLVVKCFSLYKLL